MANVLHTARTITTSNGDTQIPFTCDAGVGGVDLHNRIVRVIDPAVLRISFVERCGDWIALCPTTEVTKTSDTTGFVTIKVNEFRENRDLLAQQGIHTLDDLRRREERLALLD
jgi:cobyric acid synthase